MAHDRPQGLPTLPGGWGPRYNVRPLARPLVRFNPALLVALWYVYVRNIHQYVCLDLMLPRRTDVFRARKLRDETSETHSKLPRFFFFLSNTYQAYPGTFVIPCPNAVSPFFFPSTSLQKKKIKIHTGVCAELLVPQSKNAGAGIVVSEGVALVELTLTWIPTPCLPARCFIVIGVQESRSEGR